MQNLKSFQFVSSNSNVSNSVTIFVCVSKIIQLSFNFFIFLQTQSTWHLMPARKRDSKIINRHPKNSWNLKFFFHPKSHHKKFLFGKRLRRKEIESAHTGISGGLLLLWCCYQILLFWFDPHIAFFRRHRLVIVSSGIFFGFCLYTQNISMSQVEINLVFLTRFTLSYYNWQFKKKSLSIYTSSISSHLIASSFTGLVIRALRHRLMMMGQNKQARESSRTSPTNNETRFNSRYTDLVFHDVHEKIYLVKLDKFSLMILNVVVGAGCYDSENDMPAIVV